MNLLYAQKKNNQKSEFNSAIIIKMTPIPFLFETGVGGKLKLDRDSLSFTPYPCRASDKRFSTIIPCNNDLIKNINFDFNSILQIKRRNYLLIVPNRILVKTKDGNAFIFTTFKRRKIIDYYKVYKLENSSVSFIDS